MSVDYKLYKLEGEQREKKEKPREAQIRLGGGQEKY